MGILTINDDFYKVGDMLIKWIDGRWIKLGHLKLEDITKKARKQILEKIEKGE